MKYIPAKALEIIELTRVLEAIGRLCYGQQGRDLCLGLKPVAELAKVEEELSLALDAKKLIGEGYAMPMRSYENLEECIRQLAVNDYVVELEELAKLRDSFLLQQEILGFWSEELASQFGHLYGVSIRIPHPGDWLKMMGKILDEEGDVRADASPLLLQISRKLSGKRSELEREFERLARQYKKSGFLAEQGESFRNGRRVFSFQAEHKRKVRGLIHDASSSGKTAFIEPEEIMMINNEIFELEGDYRQEVIRLLRELCNQLRPDLALIKEGVVVIPILDCILARGRYAHSIGGHKPKVREEPVFHLLNAMHPLLISKLRGEGRKPVSFELLPGENGRILILSGPNAGGKTVLMKTVGLLQLMLQSGILIPASPDSEMGIFTSFFVEIGDQQSIEDDLSTYSSHLQHMKEIIGKADEKSLILIDEFGSGTDPKIGGAIAEAILDKIIRTGSYAVVTTHYGNLKSFGFNTPGVSNGAMIFDQENMSPTYQFELGKPGSSFAFEIADKTGFPRDVMQYARNKAGKNQIAIEDMLSNLQKERDDLQKRNTSLEAREKHLEQLIRNYEALKQDLDVSKKRWKLERKEQNAGRISQLEKELQEAIKAVKDKQDLRTAEKKKKELGRKKEEVQQSLGKLREEVFREELEEFDIEQLKTGDHVQLRHGSTVGEILSIDKKEATVLAGAIRLNVPLHDLRPVKAPIEQGRGLSVQKNISDRNLQQFQTTLDIRGMRPEAALPILQQFYDEAIMSQSFQVKVIHGKGKGLLRKLVHNTLKEYEVIKHSHPPSEQGGDGVTLIEFG